MQPGCRGIDLPTGGLSKDTTDVGEPPSGMPPSAGTSTMTITTNLALIKARLDLADAPCSVRHPRYRRGRRTYRVYDENVPVNDRPARPGPIDQANEGRAAGLAGQTGIAMFRVAFDRWTNDTGQCGLTELVRESFDELKALTAGS